MGVKPGDVVVEETEFGVHVLQVDGTTVSTMTHYTWPRRDSRP